ncbi:cardiolipin synthase [Mariniflexile fucanivorans]|uniref:Cardiolipin synthase n=1 Tax=Mariniflexile fucanivorans TaxID=264023 RepID=A0A4R1RBJ3_9FLAO|nr:cardiolipin synthase [Mariniflexile fucanivorans]TCL63161.1 cardiolipin synthase [Mariniflexile fucanivorans]
MTKYLIIAYFIINLWAIYSVIMYGSRATKSLSWVFTIMVFPFGGALLYYLFGVNRRKFKFFRLERSQKENLYNVENEKGFSDTFETDFPSEKSKKLSKLILNTTYLYASEGNNIEILNTGKETFGAIFKAIENAKKFIHVQYYIFEKGELQDEFYELFKAKIKKGVEIRMLYDSFGSFSFSGKLKKRFRSIGVKAYPVMPIRFGNLLFTLNYRNHRKIIIVDGDIGFTGGFNVSDKYIKPISSLGVWKDLHIKLEGPVVNSLHRVFIKDYHFSSKKKLLLDAKYLPQPKKAGNLPVQIVTSGPDSNQPAIMQQYIAMISLAERTIFIANPYFIPGSAVLQALVIAAQSGIEVNLLVPRKGDSVLATYSMFSNFEEFLSVGIHVFVRDCFSHSKVIIIDNEIASVGSGNFDHRSFEHNFETNAVIYDETITKRILEEFNKECADADKLSYETFKNRSKVQKFIEGLAKFFSPLL